MKSILLIGVGNFGKHLAIELNSLGHQIMAVDRNEERINDILDIVTNAQIGDSTNADFLRSLGVNDYDICFVAIGSDFQSSLETTCTLKELGAKHVVSRSERDGQEKFLLRNGADEVVYPDKQVARWAAIRCCSEQILDCIELDETHSIFEITMPEDWTGKTVAEVDIRRKYHINIVAIKKNGVTDMTITPDTLLTADSTLLVIGDDKTLQKYFYN